MNWKRFSNPEPAKSQAVRALDVFLIGPLMIWGGGAAHRGAKTAKGRAAGTALSVFGVATIAYNAANYVRVDRGEAC